MGNVLSFDQMVNAADVEYAIVSAPQWGGDVKLASLDAFEMQDWADQNKESDHITRSLDLLTRCLIDEEGNRIGQFHRVKELGKKNAGLIRELIAKAHSINGIGKKVEVDAAKNE